MAATNVSSWRLAARASTLAAIVAAAGLISTTTAGAAPAGGSNGDQIHIGSSIRSTSLSNEVTLTRIAYARRSAPIRSTPHSSSRTLGRLDFVTSDGQALPYVALSSLDRGSGPSWIEIRVPGRPNGGKGWVRASSLGSLRTVYGRLVISEKKLTATLYDRHGNVSWKAPVGLGRPGLSTPHGHFWVTERLRSIGGAAYGPYAFGTSAFAPHLTDWPGGGVIGIHGTDEPGLIPGRPSHGCIRLRNHDVRALWRKLDVGTPVRIR